MAQINDGGIGWKPHFVCRSDLRDALALDQNGLLGSKACRAGEKFTGAHRDPAPSRGRTLGLRDGREQKS